MSKIISQNMYRVMLHINIQLSAGWVLSAPDSSSAAGLNASHPHHRVEQLQIDTELWLRSVPHFYFCSHTTQCEYTVAQLVTNECMCIVMWKVEQRGHCQHKLQAQWPREQCEHAQSAVRAPMRLRPGRGGGGFKAQWAPMNTATGQPMGAQTEDSGDHWHSGGQGGEIMSLKLVNMFHSIARILHLVIL